MKKIQVIGIFLVLLNFFSVAEAKKIKFSFNGRELTKREETHGKIVKSMYCKNKIDYKKYHIWVDYLEQDPDDIYVSPDEKYFIFEGAEGPQNSPVRFFLVDIGQCKIVKEFKPGYKTAEMINIIAAAFSPNSKKLYITWQIQNGSSLGDIFNVTKEYSGDNFQTERVLKSMTVLGRAHDSEWWWIYNYKFSKHGDLLISPKVHPAGGKSHMQYVYDIAHDKILASFNEKNLDLKNKKYFKVDMSKYYNEDMMNIAPEIPDITKNYLLYNFDTPTGTEMDIYNYNDNKLVSKIINAQKGLGSFSGDGKKIIFSEFPNTTTWKRNVIVYDKSTGSVLGQAVLDEQDDIVDVSSDNTKLIYKRHGVKKTVSIR